MIEQHTVMAGCENISEKLELNRDIIKKCFQQALNGLELKEKLLNAIKESVAVSSNLLVMMGETIEARLRQVQQKGSDLHTFQEKGFKELELTLIREVMARQELLKEQEKLMEDFFEKMESKREQFETAQKAYDDRFIEICLKEGTVNLMKIQNDKRATELDKREESLARCEKEIELREAVLSSRKAELIAKEAVLDARERIIDLKKELGPKDKELHSVEKSTGQDGMKLGPINPTLFEELRKRGGRASGNSVVNARSSKRTKKLQVF